MNIIQEIRKEKGLSQTEFATMCDVGSQTIFDLEHGNRKEIHQDVLETLEQLGYKKSEVIESYDYQRQQIRENMIQQLA